MYHLPLIRLGEYKRKMTFVCCLCNEPLLCSRVSFFLNQTNYREKCCQSSTRWRQRMQIKQLLHQKHCIVVSSFVRRSAADSTPWSGTDMNHHLYRVTKAGQKALAKVNKEELGKKTFVFILNGVAKLTGISIGIFCFRSWWCKKQQRGFKNLPK